MDLRNEEWQSSLTLWKEQESSVFVPLISTVAVISFQTTRANDKHILEYSSSQFLSVRNTKFLNENYQFL